MEERNIRWGELVGGLLIVGCSIALVISFWAQIESRGWLKFSLFNGVTAAIFGVGFYSEHRWRLKTTSRGLLTIGCLLVPLNFLAIAALSSTPGSGELLTIVGEVLSAGLFAGLVYFAGRVLIERDEIALTAGLIVPALSQLLVRRFVHPGAELPMLVAIACVPTLSYLAATFWHLRSLSAELMPDEARVNGLFRFLGLATFAVILPLALLLYKTGQPVQTLRQMPALAALLGFVPLCAGLLLWQKLAGRSLVSLRTAGTSVAALGAMVTLSGLVIGWPEPSALLPVALLEFAIFTFVAWRFALPAAHLLAAPCLGLAFLLAGHLLGGQITWTGMDSRTLAAAIVSGESGMLLAPLVLAYAGATLLALRFEAVARRELGAATCGLMGTSVALVSWFGFGPRGVPLGTEWVYLLYAVGCLAVSSRVRYATPAWIGSALLLGSVVQAVAFRFGPSLEIAHSAVGALLLYASFSAALALATAIRGMVVADSSLAGVAWRASLVVSALAATALVLLMPETTVGWQAAYWFWVSALWGSGALALGWVPLGVMFQAALALTAMLAAVTPLADRAWFNQSTRPWLDPWTLQTVGLAWVALNLAWTALRAVCARRDRLFAPNPLLVRAGDSLASPWMVVDRVLTVALVALLGTLGAYAALPGVLTEIMPVSNPSAFDLAGLQKLGISHQHAGDWGSWALLAGLLSLLLVMLRSHASHGWMYCAILVTACGCPLLASWFEGQRAVASGLAWGSGLWLLAGSWGVWCRTAVVRLAGRLGWPTRSGDARARQESTLLVLVLGLAAPLGLALMVASNALTRTPHLGLLGREAGIYWLGAIVLVMAGGVVSARDQAEARGRAGGNRPNWPVDSGALLLLLGVMPVVAVMLYHVAMALSLSPIEGPGTQSIFGRLGLPLAYSGPLLLISLALVGYGLRERSGGFALAGGFALGGAATTAYLVAHDFALMEVGTWVRVAQLDAIVAAVYTVGWIAIPAWDARREGRYGLTASGPLFGRKPLLHRC